MDIILIGNTNLTLSVLNHIIKSKIYNIKGVITKEKINTENDEIDLSIVCKKNKILCKKISNINSKNTINWISKITYDYIFCIGFSQLIKGSLLNKNKNKIIGFHPTDLPSNKGRHPIVWSIILGLRKSAISFFIINKDADSGKIIYKKLFNVPKYCSATKFYKIITNLVLNNLKVLKEILNAKPKIIKIKKNENYWRKRKFDDGVIDWRMSADNIYKHYLALSYPYPNISFKYKEKFYVIKKCRIIKTSKFSNQEPGKIIFKTKKSLFVKCSENVIRIDHVKPKLNFNRIKYLI